MDLLIQSGYKLAVCSNSIRKTVLTVLSRLDSAKPSVLWIRHKNNRKGNLQGLPQTWDKVTEWYNWIVRQFGEICGWIGLILIHGSTVPVTYLAIKGEPTVLPPLSMVVLIWSGLGTVRGYRGSR